MGGEPGGGIPGDTFKLIIMMAINYKVQFYILYLKERIKGGLRNA